MNIPLLIAMYVLFNSIMNFCLCIPGFNWCFKWLANILGSSTWAEIYGVKYIGCIKALTTAFMVFSTAFGTALFGF